MSPSKRTANELKYTIPGLFHPIDVHLVSRRYLNTKYRAIAKKPIPRSEILNGFYSHEKNKIYICKELAKERRSHTLLHEIVHMILEESADYSEEVKCDNIGAYLLNLILDDSFRTTLNKIENLHL